MKNPMFSVKSILWPFDGSEESRKALETAVVLASQFKAKIHGVHVINSLPTLSTAAYRDTRLAGFDQPLYEAQLRKSSKVALEQAVAERVPEGIEVETRLETGIPKDIIADYARDHGIDLIVMSTHGRSGMSRIMLGSVTESTIRTSSVPILVIPRDQ
jgi:nucleotide-binding universal stress UspA family protein